MGRIKLNIYKIESTVLNELIEQHAINTNEDDPENIEVDEDTYNELMQQGEQQQGEQQQGEQQQGEQQQGEQQQGEQQEEKPKKKMKTAPDAYIKPKEYDHIKNLVINKIYPLIIGQAGIGKTELAIALAKDLNLNFYSEAQISDPFTQVKGYRDANGNYIETAFFKAYTQGGLFLLDEIDASDSNALIALNQAIAQNCYTFGDGILHAKHEDFKLIATANTFGDGANIEYIGRNQLDAATLNRFQRVKMSLSSKVLNKICKNKEMVEFIKNLNTVCAKLDNHVIISYRSIIMLDKMFKCEGEDYLKTNMSEILFPNLEKQDISQIANEMPINDDIFTKALRTLGGLN